MKSFLSFTILIGSLILSPQLSQAATAVKAEDLDYKAGTTELQGFLAQPAKTSGAKPGFIIVHNWMGLTEANKDEAKEFAKQGYTALAADVYGKGVRPKNAEEAGKLAGAYKGNRGLLRERIKAAYDTLVKTPGVDSKKIVVLGYCFGGTTALELAYTGVPLAGIATFHGGLQNPTPEDAKKITGKVLVMHGAIDPYVKAEEVAAFEKQMNDAGKDYQLIKYSGAVHSFTERAAGNDIKVGAAYNETAAKRSHAHFEQFLKEIL